MGKPRLAIVGASARAAAFSALAAGFDVVTADLFADEDLCRRCPATRVPAESYPEGLADWLAEQDVDAWMYTGALENHPELVDRMAAIKPLWGNRGEELRRVRDPLELQRVCRENRLLFPETRVSTEGLPLDGSWLCKTHRGAGGSGVWAFQGGDALRRAKDSQVLQQKRINGVAGSAVFLALDKRLARLESCTQQLVGEPRLNAPRFAYCGSVAAAEWRTAHASAIDRIGSVLSQTFGLIGLFGVDFVVDRNSVWVIEINPRFPASAEVGTRPRGAVLGHAIACGFDNSPRDRMPVAPVSGKAILYAKQPAVVAAGFQNWALNEADTGRLADIPAAGTVIETGNPVLTILDHGPEAGVLNRLKTRAAEVESWLFT